MAETKEKKQLPKAKAYFVVECPECGMTMAEGAESFKPEILEAECETCEEKVQVPRVLIVFKDKAEKKESE